VSDPIAFVTLFLGLVTGFHQVDLTLANNVETVEIIIDGEPQATLSRAPWTCLCDFGPELLPHTLVALARDDKGKLLGQAEQWVNLPGPLAEASLMIKNLSDTGYQEAQLVWDSVFGEDPSSIGVTFDGTPLMFSDSRHITLPPHDLGSFHLLRATVEFGQLCNASTEVIFGGDRTAVTSSDLTAFPVMLTKRRLPPLQEMQEWFLLDDHPLVPMALESRPGEVILVVDRATFKLPLVSLAKAGPSGRLRHGDHLRFLWAIPDRHYTSDSVYALYSPYEIATKARQKASMLVLLSTLHRLQPPQGPQRLADAVAAAGLNAHHHAHPRAVVLLLSDNPVDTSQYTPAEARGFLSSLGVPLVVWSMYPAKPKPGPWGPTQRVTNRQEIGVATKKLVDLLEDQRIIWLGGKHLARQVTLSPDARRWLSMSR